jgi:hypothetical protein
MFAALRVRRVERLTIQRFRDAGANTAERAILLEAGMWFGPVVYRRLERAGVLRRAANDRYYLEQPAYEAFRRRRRIRGLVVLTILLTGIAIVYLLGGFA